jgi:hypothetical protein
MKLQRIFQRSGLSMICTLLLISSSSLFAQVNFSGTWALNESESNIGEFRFGAIPEMVVEQQGNTITIERTRSGRDGQRMTTSETLTMDGKENVNKGENRSSTSTVTWSGDKTTMTIKSSIEMNFQGNSFNSTSTENWKLDGAVLTIQSTTSSQRGDRSMTLVYDKK